MLCREDDRLPVVYNVPGENDRPGALLGNVRLSAEKYSLSHFGRDLCFAGENDELVVAASADRSLHIWSVTEGDGDRRIDQSLLAFHGHQGHVIGVRFNKAYSTLASCGFEGVVKLWTPIDQ